MTVFAGDPPYAADLNAMPRGLIARHTRGTAGALSGVTTETGFIRLDSIPVRSGYSYRVVVPRCNITVSATTASGVARLRGSTSGTATTASTQLDSGEVRSATPVTTSSTDVKPLIGYWHSTVNGTLSVLWSVARDSAAGSVGLYATTGQPTGMFVEEVGLTPADAGTDL